MIILSKIVHETVWGGHKLAQYANDYKTKIGHLYSAIDNSSFQSVIINGKYNNKKLHDYFTDTKKIFGLDTYENFPLVLALVEAKENLSIQVHPDLMSAKQIENINMGKNESWYFIDPPTNGKIFNGCKCNDINIITNKVITNKIFDIVDYLEVKAEDYVFVEAGTLHSMAAGSLVYEIEENCDLTYRFYDFERKDKNGNLRQLQIDNAIKSLHPTLKSCTKTYTENEAIYENLYSTQLYKQKNKYINNSNTLECVTFIKGNNIIDNIPITVGTTIILEPNEFIEVNNSDFIVSRPKTMEEYNA